MGSGWRISVLCVALMAMGMAACTPATSSIDGGQYLRVTTTGRRAWTAAGSVDAPAYSVGAADDGTLVSLAGTRTVGGPDGDLRVLLDLARIGDSITGRIEVTNVAQGKKLIGFVSVPAPKVRSADPVVVRFDAESNSLYRGTLVPGSISIELTVGAGEGGGATTSTAPTTSTVSTSTSLVPPADSIRLNETTAVGAVTSGGSRSWTLDTPNGGDVNVHVAPSGQSCPDVQVVSDAGEEITALSGCGTTGFVGAAAGRYIVTASSPSAIPQGSTITLSTPVSVGPLAIASSATQGVTSAPSLLPGQQARWTLAVAGGEQLAVAGFSITGAPTSVRLLDPDDGVVASSSPDTGGIGAAVDLPAAGTYQLAVTNEDHQSVASGNVKVRASTALDGGNVPDSRALGLDTLAPGAVERFTRPMSAGEQIEVVVNTAPGVCVQLLVAAGIDGAPARTGCGKVVLPVMADQAGVADLRVMNTTRSLLTAGSAEISTRAPKVTAPLEVGAPLAAVSIPAGSSVTVPLAGAAGDHMRIGVTGATGACITMTLLAGDRTPVGGSTGCVKELGTVAMETNLPDGSSSLRLDGDRAIGTTVTLAARRFDDLPAITSSDAPISVGEIGPGGRAVIEVGGGAIWTARRIAVAVAAGSPCVSVDVANPDGSVIDLGNACPGTPLDRPTVVQGTAHVRIWSVERVPASTVSVGAKVIDDATLAGAASARASQQRGDAAAGTAVPQSNATAGCSDGGPRAQSGLCSDNDRAARQACKPYLIVGLRGSGETTGFGGRVWTAVDRMRTRLGKDNIALIAIERPDYPSTEVPYEPTMAERTLLESGTSGGIAIALAHWYSRWRPFVDGINDGSDALYKILQMRVKCHETVILVGYSQGSMVAHRTMLDLQANRQTEILGRLAGSVLIADGDRSLGDQMIEHSATTPAHEGVTHTINMGGYRTRPLDDTFGYRTHSVCVANDAVCDLNFPGSVPSGFTIHTKRYQHSQIVQNAADTVAARARVLHYSAVGWPAWSSGTPWGPGGHVSVLPPGPGGALPDGVSVQPAISADGRYVAFVSNATNLVADQSGGVVASIYRWDTHTGVVLRQPVGVDLNFGSVDPSISADGRFVAFASADPDLIAHEIPARSNIFIWDAESGSVHRQPLGVDGKAPNDDSFFPSISGDGTRVAFTSRATNLASDDDSVYRRIYVWDVPSGTVARQPRGVSGGPPDDESGRPRISGNGRFVVFDSSSCSLGFVVQPFEYCPEVYVWDTGTDILTRPPTSSGSPSVTGGYAPDISADGRYVTFGSGRNDLVPGQVDRPENTFWWDTKRGIIRALPAVAGSTGLDIKSNGQRISGDGRHVVFESFGTGSANKDLWSWDTSTGAVQPLATSEGIVSTFNNFNPVVSSNGRYVAFSGNFDGREVINGNEPRIYLWDRSS